MRAEERQPDIGRRPAEHVGEEQDAVPLLHRADGPFHRVVDRLDAHLGGDVDGDDSVDLPYDDPGRPHQLRGERTVGNDDGSDHPVPLEGRMERDRSRWTTMTAPCPFPRRSPSASATATDRCLPPVQPTPSVKYAFPSLL